MAASNRRDLYLTVGATIDPLTAAMKSARTVMAQFGNAAIDVQKEVSTAFKNLIGDDVEAAVQNRARALNATLAKIRDNARQVVDAPTPQAAMQVINATSAAQAAAAADRQALALRAVADAAARYATETTSDAAAAKTYALAAEAAALGAEKQAVAMRVQASVAEGVAGKLEGVSGAQAEVVKGHNRLGASGMIADHVIRSFADSVAAGQSPMRAFGMQLGRIGEAMSLYAATTNQTEGVVGRFAKVLGGPWGIAVTAATSVLGILVTKLMETGEASEKAKSAEQKFADFQGELANFVDATNGKLREQLRVMAEIAQYKYGQDIRTAQKQSADLTKQAFAAARKGSVVEGNPDDVDRQGGRPQATRAPEVLRAIADAGGNMQGASGNVATLAKALSDLASKDQKWRPLADEVNTFAQGAAAAAQSINRLKGEQAELNRALNGGTVSSKELIDQQVKAETATTALEKAQVRLAAVERQGAEAEKMDRGSAKNRALARYHDELLAATKAVNALKDAEKSRMSVADESSIGDMTAMLKQVLPGVRITSTTGGRHANGSDHYAGRAIDFVPAGGMSQFTYDEMKKIITDAGVKIRRGRNGTEQFFGPGHGPNGPNDTSHDNHFHLAWEGRASPESLQRATQKAEESKATYKGELDHLDAQIAEAKRKQIKTIEDQYEADVNAIAANRQTEYDRIAREALQNKWTDAQTKVLKDKEDEAADAQTAAARRKRDERLAERQYESDRAAADAQAAILNIQYGMADTLAERRRIARELIDLDRKQRDAAIERDLGRGVITSDEAARRHEQVAAVSSEEQKRSYLDNLDPLQAYGRRIKQAAGDMSTALKGVKADALQGLEDGLVGIISGTESVASAFKKMASSIIADLARIAIEKAILGAFGTGFFGIPMRDGGPVGHYATGGFITGPGGPREDRVPIMASAGEFIVNASAARKHGSLLRALNDNSLPGFADGGFIGAMPSFPAVPSSASLMPQRQEPVQIVLRVAKGEAFDAEVLAVSGPHAVEIVRGAAPGIVSTAVTATAATLSRPKI